MKFPAHSILSTRNFPRTVRWLLPALLLFTVANMALAQMPGMPEEKPRAQVNGAGAKVEQASDVGVVEKDSDVTYGLWGRFHQKYMAVDSPYRPVILTILTILVLLNIKRYLSKIVKRQVEEKAFSKENAQSFMKTWHHIWKFIIAVLVLIAMSGSLKLLGLTAGFIGMMLGWSLQQPVTGIAAWLMIIVKKPFKIGDRVVIAGITGDVTGITLTHVILNQVGGSISGEEASGRGILIPNAILFQHVIINYTLDQKYMLDEVPVRLTFDSDWERAKEIMLAAALEVTSEIVEQTGVKPFIRAEFLDWGVLVRLRYNTIPVKRQEFSTYIIEILLREFGKEYPRVRFAVPASSVRYRIEDSDESPDFPLSP
ncbi:MAG: mechanosensitive ion channel family protein [Lentisphaeria bacterium]|nr:mechanosensitive ion channel family protein [Lentisphaeria bacterium]